MEKVHQVFVSSTYADLVDERRRVSETLAKAGYIPSGMELFPATDQQQLEFIKRVIDRCDYYVVIVGGRYGTLADDAISFTEKEYEYALERKIPVLAFLHSAPERIEVGKTDRSDIQAQKLLIFRNRLSRGRIVDFWADPHELCTKVVIAVAQAINLSPGIGWVRGDQAIDPKILQELERLRAKNQELERQLDTINSFAVTFPSNLPSPDSKTEVRVYAGSNDYSPEQAQHKLKYEVSWSGIFIEVIDLILKEEDETAIGREIAAYLLPKGTKMLKSPNGKEIKSGYLDHRDIRQLRIQLEALGLIRATVRQSQREGGGSYVNNIWQITDKGRRYMAERLAVQNQSS